jgi:polysaccharide deacetylase 2 family uncharacterized protein YibQ
MFKGFLSGLFWGGMLGALVLAVLSLYAPLPTLQANTGAGVQTPAAVASSDEQAPTETTEPAQEDATPEPVDATTEDQSGALTEPTAPTPEIETAQAVEETLEIAVDEGVAANEDVVAAEETLPPVVDPAADNAPKIAAKVDTPSFSDTTDISSVKLPQVSDAVVETPTVPNSITLKDDEPADQPLIVADKPFSSLPATVLKTSPDALGFADDVAVQQAPRLGENSDDATVTTTTALVAPVISELVPSPVNNPSAIRVAGLPTPRVIKLPQVGVAQTQEVTEVSSDTPIGVEVEPIENPVAAKPVQVVTGRLPTIGSTPQTPTPQIVPTNTPDAETPSRGALTDHAIPFTSNAQSLFSIVIIDVGNEGVDREQLLNSSYPITVAIDPSVPDAAALMAQYRAAGIEVVALLNDLPPSAAPGDVAVAISGYFGVLDQAVAVMEPLDRRLQNNRELLEPVLGAISDTGHGLMTYEQGLNATQRSAQRLGVPSAAVFRVLDAEGEKSAKIKRYLKRAAFNAGRDGSVVVVGRSYAETMTAILEWALENNDVTLSLAPISAVLKADLS